MLQFEDVSAAFVCFLLGLFNFLHIFWKFVDAVVVRQSKQFGSRLRRFLFFLYIFIFSWHFTVVYTNMTVLLFV